MAPRRRTARPVEIVLTEEDLAAIIRETVGPVPKPPSPAGPPPEVRGPRGEPFAIPAGVATGGPADAPFSPIGDAVWRLGVRSPGAVGDAIRMILEATTLDRGRGAGPEEEE